MDIEKTPNGHKLLDVIRIIAFHGETGRLEMTVGSSHGFFFFKYGRLVDASIGSLYGFQAVNAAVSMGQAHFNFDPSIAPPPVSSITANERTILKQFFDIEAVDPQCDHYVRESEPEWDGTPVPVVPLADVEVAASNEEQEHVVAAVAQPAESEEERFAEVPVLPGFLPSVARHRTGIFLAILLVVMGVSVFALVNGLRNRRVNSVARQDEQVIAKQSEEVVGKPSQPIEKPSVPSIQVPARKSTQSEQDQSVAQDLTGEWKLVNNVKKTAYRSFENLELGFRLVINQTGNKFRANGEKVSENGRSLPARGRTPIQLVGTIEGDRVEGTFFEEGALRKTNGRFVWRIQKNGSGLAGTFVTNAASSSGNSSATKEL